MKERFLSRRCIRLLLTKVGRSSSDCRGQALPLAIAALAVGALLVSPFLVDASANLLASRHVDSAIKDYYSLDAGIEWGLWHLRGQPNLTSSTSFISTPLEPFPETVNGQAFPSTEVRRASHLFETVSGSWQSEGGGHCFGFVSTADGLVLPIVQTSASSAVIDVIPSGAACAPQHPWNLSGTSPYSAQFSEGAGSYQIYVDTGTAAGSVMVQFPTAAYDLRSQNGDKSITARVSVGAVTLQVVSWQVEPS
jgi:hypothetical protein